MARNYPDNGYSSVTEVLGVLRKFGLENWFKYNSATFCNKESSKGKKVGKQIHEAIEQYITTGSAKVESEYAEEVNNALQSFISFRKDYPDIKLGTAEISLTSEEHKFNGTIDAPEPPILCDWKSGNAKDEEKPPIYDEAKTQVSAYVHLWNEKNPSKKIDTAYIVALAKDKVAYNVYKMEELEIYSEFLNVFLPCLKIKNYQKDKKRRNK